MTGATMELALMQKEGVNFPALLSFGVDYDGSRWEANSHFTIVSRELNIPFCVAEAPLPYREHSRGRSPEWKSDFPLRGVHGQLGSLTLERDGDGTRVKVQA